MKISDFLQKTLSPVFIYGLVLMTWSSLLSASESVQTTLYDLNKTVSVGGTNITDAVSLGSNSYFLAPHGESESALWRYDYEAQREYVIDLGFQNPNPRVTHLTVANEQLYFSAFDESELAALWRYDDVCNCALKTDISFTAISNIATQHDQLLLIAENHVTGSELWHLDPKSNRFNLVKDFNPGAAGSGIGNLVFSESQLYFLANDEDGIREVWGYNARTSQLTEYSAINGVLRWEDAHYFAHILAAKGNWVAIEIEKRRLGFQEQKRGSQLWLLHTSNSFALQIDELNHQAKCDDGEGYSSYFIPTQATFSDDSLYYVGDPDNTYDRVWRYNLSTRQKADIGEGKISEFSYNGRCFLTEVTGFHAHDNDLYFARTDALEEDAGLWHFDTETQNLAQLSNVRYIDSMLANDDALLFKDLSTISGNKLYALDFDSNRVAVVTNSRGFAATNVEFFASSRNPLVLASSPKWGRQLWQLDAALKAERLTAIVTQNTESNPRDKMVFKDRLYLAAKSEVTGRRLWYIENEKAVPKLHPFTIPEEFGPDPELRFVEVHGDFLYFSVNTYGKQGFWRLNAADGSVTRLTSLEAMTNDSLSLFTVNNDRLYFSTYSSYWSDFSMVRLVEYVPESDTASAIYNGDGKVLYLDEEQVFLFRNLYNADGSRRYKELWRFGRHNNSLEQLEIASEYTGCSTGESDSGKAYRTSNYFYFFRDREFLRLDPSDDSLTNLGCAADVFSLEGKIYYLTLGDSFRLMHLPEGSTSGEVVTSLDINHYKVSGDSLYFMASDSEDLMSLWQFDAQPGSLQLIKDFSESEVALRQVVSVGDQNYFATETTTLDHSKSQLWQPGLAQPLFEFGNTVTHAPDQGNRWVGFAGDIWLAGGKTQNGYTSYRELLRVHLNTSASRNSTLWDFDGDGKADPVFRDKISQYWTVFNSDDQTVNDTRFGFQGTDIPVSADFDGDGIFDLAFRRPNNRYWVVINSSGSNYNSDEQDGIQRLRLGMNEKDIPVPADYDGDGIADFAVRRPSFGGWIIRHSSDQKIVQIRFGSEETDIPVTGDFDGDGKADLAFRRPDNKTWYIQNSGGSNYNSDKQDGIQRVVLGLRDEDIPVSSDYDGDGITDIAVWRPSMTRFIIRQSRSGEIIEKRFEYAQDAVPVSADYDGDGASDAAVYYPKIGLLEVQYFALERRRQTQYSFGSDVFPVAQPTTEIMKIIK